MSVSKILAKFIDCHWQGWHVNCKLQLWAQIIIVVVSEPGMVKTGIRSSLLIDGVAYGTEQIQLPTWCLQGNVREYFCLCWLISWFQIQSTISIMIFFIQDARINFFPFNFICLTVEVLIEIIDCNSKLYHEIYSNVNDHDLLGYTKSKGNNVHFCTWLLISQVNTHTHTHTPQSISTDHTL